MMKNNKLLFPTLIIEICLLLNMFLIPGLYIIYIFTGIFIFIIYKYFAENARRLLYYSTVLFSIEFLSLYLPIGSKYSIYYFYLSIFAYFVISIVELIKNYNKGLRKFDYKNKYFLFFIVFIAYSIFSIVLAGHKFVAIKSIITYIIMFGYVFMLIHENKKSGSLKKTFKLLGLIYTGVLILGTSEILGFNFLLRNHYSDFGFSYKLADYVKRIPVVFFYNPNNYAIFIVMGMIAVFISYIFCSNRKTKIFLLSIYLISQINLIFTTCRIACITVMLVFIFAYIISSLIKNYRIRSLTLNFCIGTAIIFFLLSLIPYMGPYYGRFTKNKPIVNKKIVVKTSKVKEPKEVIRTNNSIISVNKVKKAVPIAKNDNAEENSSTKQRLTIIKDVLTGVVLKGHLLGFGAGNTTYYIESFQNTNGVINVHSLFFEILGDFGVPICLYTAFIYLILLNDLIKKSVKNGIEKNYYEYILGLCVFAVIFLSFAPSTIITFTPFWMLIGLSIAVVLNNFDYNK